jgi:hypothetical protein
VHQDVNKLFKFLGKEMLGLLPLGAPSALNKKSQTTWKMAMERENLEDLNIKQY